jgi:hypothetical protein
MGSSCREEVCERISSILAGADDDFQAQVISRTAQKLEAICEEAKERDGTNLGADWQWRQVGRHLGSCACSSEAGRGAVRAMHSGLEASSRTVQPIEEPGP